jgi:uncharacterized protein
MISKSLREILMMFSILNPCRTRAICFEFSDILGYNQRENSPIILIFNEGIFMINHSDLKERIKKAVISVDPSAEVLLYGSQARNESTDDSDWDILILTQERVTEELRLTLRHRLYEIEWDMGEIINSIIHHVDEWKSPPLCYTPLHKNVSKEAVHL